VRPFSPPSVLQAFWPSVRLACALPSWQPYARSCAPVFSQQPYAPASWRRLCELSSAFRPLYSGQAFYFLSKAMKRHPLKFGRRDMHLPKTQQICGCWINEAIPPILARIASQAKSQKSAGFITLFFIIRERTKIPERPLTNRGPCIFGQIAANHPSAGRPSRRRKIAFTFCGFAFPPVAFITWPTNQAAAFGFALTSSARAELAAIT
jgi:hypothetical protein